jgi:hypothetical protein
MGRVIEFSLARRNPRDIPDPARAGPAEIIILPVVRIEREAAPAAVKKNLRSSTRKRRKRAPAANRRSG